MEVEYKAFPLKRTADSFVLAAQGRVPSEATQAAGIRQDFGLRTQSTCHPRPIFSEICSHVLDCFGYFLSVIFPLPQPSQILSTTSSTQFQVPSF